MKKIIFPLLASLAWLSAHAADQAQTSDQLMLAREAAGRLDDTFGYVAQSIVAVGDEYERWLTQHHSSDPEEILLVQIGEKRQGDTIEFHSWPKDQKAPTFQQDFPAYYSYAGVDTAATRAVEAFRDLTPVLRAAYHSFDFSWVYLTTAGNHMVIYPYLPLEDAVNNYPPTKQVYYTVAADIDAGQTAWTEPYLDLVGAGLMVTVSTPVYHKDELAAVASRDITLKQLTQSVLENIVAGTDAQAIIVDSRGLAIDASDAAMEQELQSVNTAQKSAALYYLSEAELKRRKLDQAVASKYAWANEAVTQLFSEPNNDAQLIELDDWRIAAAPIPRTQWSLLLARPR